MLSRYIYIYKSRFVPTRAFLVDIVSSSSFGRNSGCSDSREDGEGAMQSALEEAVVRLAPSMGAEEVEDDS